MGPLVTLISLMVFVLWEVVKMILLAVIAIRFQRYPGPSRATCRSRFEKYQAEQDELMMRLHYAWAVLVLPTAIFTGLAAGGVLIHAFVTNLF